MILKIRPILVYVFTVRCYTERVIATASRPSVCLSVTLRYRGHTGWNTSKVISWLISLGCSLSADPNTTNLLQKEGTPEFLARMGEVDRQHTASCCYLFAVNPVEAGSPIYKPGMQLKPGATLW